MNNDLKAYLLWAVAFALIIGSRVCAAEKKLIQFGSSDPDTQFLRANIAEIQATPFDGTVFYTRGQNNAGTYLTYGAWGTTTFSKPGMQYAVDDLLATTFGSFNENFLHMNVTPANVDWFDSGFSRITSNAGTAGWIVGQGGVRGILLDTEAYEGQLWTYTTQKYASTKSFGQYQTEVRQRGQEFMQAIQAEAPNATIMLTHAYSSVWHFLGGNASGLQGSSQALLPAFLDGMVAAAGPGIKLVDGNESLFGARSLQEFLAGHQATVSGVLPIVQDPIRYAEKVSTAFPAWMNQGGFSAWHGDPAEFNQNYYTPEQFKSTLVSALNVSNQYAWVYGESLYWWNYGGTKNIPLDYRSAVTDAKAMANATPVPHAYTTMFSDGSENSVVGAIPGTTDPTVGVWDFHHNDTGNSLVLIRTGATVDGPSAAYSGSNYFQIGRGPANQIAMVGAVFDSPVTLATTSLHAEFQAFIKQAATNGVCFGFQEEYAYAPWLDELNTLNPIILGDNEGVAQGTLWYFNGTSFVKTAAALTDNAWNKVTLDWDHTTGKFTVGINGVSTELPLWGGATTISRLQIFPSWTEGTIFLDDLLIQSSVVLAGDVNFDGVVNIFDINLVSSHWGETGPVADANGDMIVNIFDINLISSNWTPSGGAAAAVPEPSTFPLLALGLLLAPIRLARRRAASVRGSFATWCCRAKT